MAVKVVPAVFSMCTNAYIGATASRTLRRGRFYCLHRVDVVRNVRNCLEACDLVESKVAVGRAGCHFAAGTAALAASALMRDSRQTACQKSMMAPTTSMLSARLKTGQSKLMALISK